MNRAAAVLRRILEAVTMLLIVALACVVVSAVVARYAFNASFIWYDEVASIMLAWITFYGAALAAVRRRHLGFPGLVLAAPPRARRALFLLGEAVVIAVFATLAYGGWVILGIFGGETLVSLRWVPLWFTQSVVPIGCLLFITAQLLSAPQAWADAQAGRSGESDEIEEEIARAAEAERRRSR